MRKVLFAVSVILSVVLFACASPAAQETAPWARVEAFAGNVTVGTADAQDWSAVKAGMGLVETQLLKTGPQSQATVKFTEGEMVISVPEKTQISLQDLLLKARLEKMRGKIAPPVEDVQQTKMQVTPLTGVRGTEESESKAEDPKRQHHWEENAEGK